MTSRAAEQFARVIVEMAPYADEIVFVGGWVHALYLAEANETEAIGTEDIDITIPGTLLTRDRPTLLELAARAGFERDLIEHQNTPGETREGSRIHPRDRASPAPWRQSVRGIACSSESISRGTFSLDTRNRNRTGSTGRAKRRR